MFCKVRFAMINSVDSSLNLIRLWRSTFELTIGEISRYRIRFDVSKHLPSTAWPPTELVLKVTNASPFLLRGALLSGPYNISVSCIQTSQHRKKPLSDIVLPQTKGCIRCGESWTTTLEIPFNGIGDWTIDILSEVVFTSTKVKYDVEIFAAMPEGVDVEDELKIFDSTLSTSEDGSTTTFSPSITYEFTGSRDVFKKHDLRTLGTKDIHLVVLTHGIHGSTLDKLFLKEAIEEKYMDRDTSRIVFFMSDVNHSCTEDGIETCGKRLADSLLEYLEWPWADNLPLILKISLIGHSLGGLINIFLIGYLNSVTNGKFFRDIQPINFIAMASPLLGSSEHPWFVKAGMRLGVIGQTGKDLALIPRSRSEQEHARGAVEEDTFGEPLLLALAQPTSPSHMALRQFRNRTIYANVGNDISVSFRTSALYFYNHDEVNAQERNILQKLFLLLNPPEATEEYITRSARGLSPIIHDKVYHPSDIPRSRDTSDNMLIEEKIARAWHEDMSWRKVFVKLEGEAHTNMIVRRKWHNAAGWQVIEHLLNEHEF